MSWLSIGISMMGNVAATGGGGAAWAPSSAATALATWYDPSDLTTLFKDTAGTVPVTADGDLVARINDKSGNGNHLLQATSGNRPIYKTNSGKPYLDLPVANLAFMATSGAITLTDGSGQHTAAAAVMFYSPGTNSVFDADNPSGTRLSQLVYSNGGTVYSIAFNAAVSNFQDAGPALTANIGQTVREITSTSAVETWLNGSSNGSTAVTPPMQAGTAILTMGGHDNSSSSNLNGRFYGGAIWKGVLSSGDQTSSDTYFAAKY